MAGTNRGTTDGRRTPVGTLEIRELECFLVLAEVLHFGRTGERLCTGPRAGSAS